MKELEFLKIIKETLSDSSYIGDDCAYLKDIGIVITQDSLVEDIHFSLNFSTPYQLGYKSIVVNLSDIFASGAIPKYLTISLSLPKNIDEEFLKEFYSAVNDLSEKYNFEVIGGDITGSNKIFISICAIGTTYERKISSRTNAKIGDYVIVTGEHGSSAAGLWMLQHSPELALEGYNLDHLLNCHLKPLLDANLSKEISTKIDRDYAMMDTSDGLVDALFKIAQSSNVTLSVDFDKIPYDKRIEEVAKLAKINFIDWILYGGEDYQLIACIDEENLKKIQSPYNIIGKVKEKSEDNFVEIVYFDKTDNISNLEKTFNHFRQ